MLHPLAVSGAGVETEIADRYLLTGTTGSIGNTMQQAPSLISVVSTNTEDQDPLSPLPQIQQLHPELTSLAQKVSSPFLLPQSPSATDR